MKNVKVWKKRQKWKSGQEGRGGGEGGAGGGDESDTVHEEDPNDEKTWWTGDQTHECKVHVFEMKTIERRKGQLLKYKIINYRLNERPDKNEEEVVQEEEVGQEGNHDGQKMENVQVN